MTSATFDTLKAQRLLVDNGMDEKQADAVVSMTRDAVTDGVATKTDIAQLEIRIAELKILIESNHSRTMMAVIALVASAIAIIKWL